VEEKNIYLAILESISQILNSFVSDIIVREVEWLQCLFERVKFQTRNLNDSEIYRVSSYGIGEIVSPFVSDLVIAKFEFFYRLKGKMKKEMLR
jgi:hypothetical protein